MLRVALHSTSPVRRDVRILANGKGTCKQFERACSVAGAIFHPGEAVGDERVAGRQAQGRLDQLARFVQVILAFGKRIASALYAVVVGLGGNEFAQQPFHGVEIAGSASMAWS